MELYLTLLALCSAALLQVRVVHFADAQSGELRPGSSSGSGSGEDAYREMIEDIRQRNKTGDFQIGEVGSGTSPPVYSSPGDSSCRLYSHNVEVTFHGCVGEYPALSCSGRCITDQIPNVFRRRQDATVDPHITTCRCCSQVRYGFHAFNLNLTCSDGSLIRVRQITAVALDCGCTACY